MAQNETYDYLYVVQWDDAVHRPPFTVHHAIKLNAGVSREEFEKYMKDEGFPAIGAGKKKPDASNLICYGLPI